MNDIKAIFGDGVSLYDILQVDSKCDAETIKKSYRRAALKWVRYTSFAGGETNTT